ncbi:N-lysine methyltransferase SETD8-like protein, partial [Aphelenchoides avenae]
DYITMPEAKQREKQYDATGIKDCYQLCVQELCGRPMVIDPTLDESCMARFLNHSHLAPNLEMRPAYVDGRVRAILYAKRFIPATEELTFDYDDRRKAVVMAKPWLVET